ncbi:adrenocortical dysplasia protein homolog isoform X2 [Rhinichthys klamathensis goyatoka]|uniref:adrenocortical dysplasia protein homolog isoform X2 n=1 Tax=Rhinichthys klamathensis goyatoka TaxID=3034132 RepID=UPI0024B50FCB|nr:adrenocortical dysplasia protein homolog isoform X2 [Rhinichthys klamathensis goyatoka]
MNPPKIKRRRMAELEPWIEKLIQNYGQSQCETTVKANVVGVCDISDSQRTEHTDACMLFMSDGSAVIPAVLSEAAWERLQDLDEMETFTGLHNAIVYVRSFELNFDMNPDLASCQFYLKVNQLNTVCIASKRQQPPSCTTLSSVRDQIIKTWRSHREGSVSSSSGVSLSSLLEVWHNDIIINILNDATEKISMSATYCPSVATPTHWHRERLHWRGQEQFIVPVPFLLIPEEQRELITADPSAGSESETPNGLAPPPEESHPTSTSIANQTVVTQDNISGSCPDDGQSTLIHTRPEVLCGTGELSGDGESPWDMYTQEPALLGRRSTSDSNDPELESQSLLKEVPSLPIATSTQNQFSKQNSGGMSVDGITLSQRPKPTQFSPSLSSGKSIRDPSQEHDRERAVSPPSWLVHNTAPPSEQRPLVSPDASQNPSASPPTKATKVHSDGMPFSYLYCPQPQVTTALAHFQIPGHLIQWAVRYLGTSDCADVNAKAGS